jgi:hypothetical protein
MRTILFTSRNLRSFDIYVVRRSSSKIYCQSSYGRCGTAIVCVNEPSGQFGVNNYDGHSIVVVFRGRKYGTSMISRVQGNNAAPIYLHMGEERDASNTRQDLSWKNAYCAYRFAISRRLPVSVKYMSISFMILSFQSGTCAFSGNYLLHL